MVCIKSMVLILFWGVVHWSHLFHETPFIGLSFLSFPLSLTFSLSCTCIFSYTLCVNGKCLSHQERAAVGERLGVASLFLIFPKTEQLHNAWMCFSFIRVFACFLPFFAPSTASHKVTHSMLLGNVLERGIYCSSEIQFCSALSLCLSFKSPAHMGVWHGPIPFVWHSDGTTQITQTKGGNASPLKFP